MTLEEGADGICSVSYLSKLETNQIDPNQDFVERLVERFDLKEKIAFNQEQYEKDLMTLTHHMIHLEKPDMTMLNHYDERKDHQAYLVSLIIHHLNHQQEDIQHVISAMFPFIPHLKQEELVLFLLCVCQWLCDEDRYRDAYHIILEVPNQHESYYDHYLLTLRMRLFIAFQMHHEVDLHLWYHHYIQEVNHQGYYHLIKEMRQQQLIYLAHALSPEAIKEIQQTSDRYLELGDKPLAISYFKHQRYDEVIHLAQKQTDVQGWVFIYLISLYRQGYYDQIHAFFNQHTSTIFSPSEELIIRWIRVKMQEDTDSLLHMIRHHFMPNHLTIDHPTIFEYITMDIAKTLAEHQFYKESYQILKQYLRRAQSIKHAQFLTIDEA